MMLDLFETSWRDLWAGADEQESVGAIFTRPEIVALMLDLAEYHPDSGRLAELRLLEPSCGDGAFTTTIISRLVASEQQHATVLGWNDPILDNALRAADINSASLEGARRIVVEQLTAAGCTVARAAALAHTWIVHTDFLLASWPHAFDLVVGNPPYVRIEELPKVVLQRYRALYRTTTDRADLYIPFFERGLQLLAPNGRLVYICANRWTRNQYGAALRWLVASQYRVRYFLNLEHTQPFLSDVSAYPAIFLLDRKRGGATRAATLDDIEAEVLAVVAHEMTRIGCPEQPVSEFDSWYADGGPWTTTCAAEHAELAGLSTLPLLEASAPGTKVGIGVATGADHVFVLPERHPTIEPSRQIPILMAANISSGGLAWSGRFLVNPFADADDGSLVALHDYPGLHAYFAMHSERLTLRHVAKARPQAWYRTIDRVWPELQGRPKLVIPDIQAGGVVGYDEGHYYPHHNVYWVTSDTWDLRALQALLRSSLVFQQVRAYSVQMRGGSVRYQSQTLRRIRIPAFVSLTPQLVQRLAAVAESGSQQQIDAVAAEAFAFATSRSAHAA